MLFITTPKFIQNRLPQFVHNFHNFRGHFFHLVRHGRTIEALESMKTGYWDIRKYKKKYKFLEKDVGGVQFKLRDYGSYSDYVKHQASKYFFIKKRLAGSFDRRRDNFLELFGELDCLKHGGSILCLGARDGAEVDALRNIGLLAIGIDVAFPKNSPYVHFGDFNHIPYPDGCFDFAYTNAFDHIFTPESILKDVRRVLVSGGLFIIDLTRGAGGAYESIGWENIDDLIAIFEKMGCTVVQCKRRPDGNRMQAILKM